jgi:hypothetical protein
LSVENLSASEISEEVVDANIFTPYGDLFSNFLYNSLPKDSSGSVLYFL